MSLKNVINRFALVSGLEQEEISKWIFVIVDCIEYFESMCNTKNMSKQKLARLTHACAVYAYYKYSMLTSNEVESFKVMDIQVDNNSRTLTDKAKFMWEQQLREISDIVDFDDFCFCRVSI